MNNIFEQFVINNELILTDIQWVSLKSLYSETKIINDISNAIELFDIKLPYREISIDDVSKDYLALKNLNTTSLIKEGEWHNKFDYKYSILPKYVDLSNVGNKASDYFHQEERWKCDATGYPSPQKTWETEKFRLTLFKALYSLKVKEINPQVLRNIISLRKYIAAQFRPSAAKTIYDMFDAESVLDFSMGWGDRIAGAYASKSVKRYVGIDPNRSLYFGYLGQLKTYQTIESNTDLPKKFNAKLYPNCAESEEVSLDEEFDLIFTSPPYFDKEKYDQSDLQSYKKYKEFDSWMKDFLFKTIELRSENLKSGGHLIINVSDIYTRKKLYKICDGMNDYITNTSKFEYVGAIGLRMPKRPMPKRPMSKSSEKNGIFCEPIWIWKKK
jgi:hypothetical protein